MVQPLNDQSGYNEKSYTLDLQNEIISKIIIILLIISTVKKLCELHDLFDTIYITDKAELFSLVCYTYYFIM